MSDAKHPVPRQEPRPDRRGFFRHGLSKTLGALLGMVEQASPVPIPATRTVLRPPGALAEKDFLRTCYRCGSCVDSCPVHAIKPLQTADEEQSGTPFIDADLQACRLCENLPCTKACPSGALARIRQQTVRMGLAQWSSSRCLRTTGQDCRLCLDACPRGQAAIRLDANRLLKVDATACAGCGVCQQVCAARPKAIRAQPL